MSDSPLPIALTIAGSDSGGGAGIQADLKTFHSFRVFGTSAVTAVTAQNTVGVSHVHPVPVESVREQLRALAADLPPSAFKTGMLATRELVEAVAHGVGDFADAEYVLDPVMVSTAGDPLLAADAVDAVRELLIPRASLLTPNLPEAAILIGRAVETVEDLEGAAQALLDLGPRAVLLKGGHLPGDLLVDVLVHPGGTRRWERERVATRHTHGTGCTLSAAAVACLARRMGLEEAVDRSLDFVARAIRAAPGLGAGHGPVNHFVPNGVD